ncbi:helix-turn-helix domain-containing protein [Frankia sp. CNm7]|uniref:Helix-turn-helix domain-containing protein n=1 Tax=Frankia nepalensis TaxID=1836974 RepID=A0A937UQL6_9ACTN|nr:helix-turn-helix transcriptional regulator [Frankia nepalensis]MBL7500973.1 helix-turn-helix domain-containing protein [Frankia nepalensis]MBL7512425.1 helix-turn-helix domain-containing protein [Frankia nepalensis]MBL7516998.1 helix-turn-helix domain-containing protein [Frankia nepalensis]MBL7631964.1 helix-turn-helix domain-containing protein [Frankia nepalensis]
MPGEGPTTYRIELGGRLRQLRERRGISRAVAGDHIRASESKVSRMELGRVGFKIRDVVDLLTLYGVHADSDRTRLLALTRLANQPGWWQRYAGVVPTWLEPYLGRESAATLIRTYHLQLVPPLLQTEDYARAVVVHRNSPALTNADLELTLGLLTARQQVLDSADPPTLWAVVDEAALVRPVGTPMVMRAQLEHLAAMSSRQNVVIQVVPSAFGAHLSEGGAFSILRFGDQPMVPDVAYLEQLGGLTCFERPDDVDRYRELINRLIVASIPPEQSVDYLAKLASRF